MQHHDWVFDEFIEEWVVIVGLEEECDCALLVTNEGSNVLIVKVYPFIGARENMCGYPQGTGDASCCVYWPVHDVQYCANMNEGSEAWDIGFKVDSTEKECDFVGCPKHFWRGCCGWRRRRGWRLD